MFLLKILLNKYNFSLRFYSNFCAVVSSNHPIWVLLTKNLKSHQLKIWFTKSFHLCSFENRSHLDKRLSKNEVIEEMFRWLSSCYHYFHPLPNLVWRSTIWDEDVRVLLQDSVHHLHVQFFHRWLKATNRTSTRNVSWLNALPGPACSGTY